MCSIDLIMKREGFTKWRWSKKWKKNSWRALGIFYYPLSIWSLGPFVLDLWLFLGQMKTCSFGSSVCACVCVCVCVCANGNWGLVPLFGNEWLISLSWCQAGAESVYPEGMCNPKYRFANEGYILLSKESYVFSSIIPEAPAPSST